MAADHVGRGKRGEDVHHLGGKDAHLPFLDLFPSLYRDTIVYIPGNRNPRSEKSFKRSPRHDSEWFLLPDGNGGSRCFISDRIVSWIVTHPLFDLGMEMERKCENVYKTHGCLRNDCPCRLKLSVQDLNVVVVACLKERAIVSNLYGMFWNRSQNARVMHKIIQVK